MLCDATLRKYNLYKNMHLQVQYFKLIFKYKPLFIKRMFSIKIKPPWKIMFFGTDDFSVSSLNFVNNEYKKGDLISALEVVTSSKAKSNSIYSYAKQENLLIHEWPVTVPNNKFDLGIIVSFGHLIPQNLIEKFNLGIINVHASLLPRWRGAAPIIHTILNEDKKTGVTIMKIEPNKFDTGKIIAQHEIEIPENILMPDLYKQLADLGATILISNLKNIPDCLDKSISQSKNGITYAPKVTPNMAKINWNMMKAKQICALARALHSLYPLSTNWNNIPIKLFHISLYFNKINQSDNYLPGTVKYRKQNNSLLIMCCDHRWITCTKIGVLGKKPMTASDFNNGYLKKEPVNKRIFK